VSTAAAPIAALTVLGILVAVLGLFIAGSVELLVVGLASLVAAGLIGALQARPLPTR
jgi:hypothetical protein